VLGQNKLPAHVDLFPCLARQGIRLQRLEIARRSDADKRQEPVLFKTFAVKFAVVPACLA
jgi:hypothetical protein